MSTEPTREPSLGATVEDSTRKAKRAAKQAKDAADEAGNVLGGLFEGVVDALGGWTELDSQIEKYNPTLGEFAEKSFLKKLSLPNKPSKFLLLCGGFGLVQSILPVFNWPLDLLGRLLGFLFLYNSGIHELAAGFGSSDTKANQVKSLLVAYLIVSTTQLVPPFLFDAGYHFGAMWSFFLPVILFITPDPTKPQQTIAKMVCDSVFSQISTIVQSLIPEGLQADTGQPFAMVGGGIIFALFWTGLLGGLGSYITIWIFLAISTINTLGRDFVSSQVSSPAFALQMTIWHNLLAMWLWRYLISGIEGISIPGVVSIIDLIIHYLPSYFLLTTAFLLAMLVTKKTSDTEKRADTWYAKWLLGGFTMAKKASSRSASAQSGTSGAVGRSSRSGERRSRS